MKRGLKEIQFNPKSNQNAKKQALHLIPRLSETLNIVRASMRLKITFPVAQAETIGPMFKESTVESNTTEAE